MVFSRNTVLAPTEAEIDENRREMFSGFGEFAPHHVIASNSAVERCQAEATSADVSVVRVPVPLTGLGTPGETPWQTACWPGCGRWF